MQHWQFRPSVVTTIAAAAFCALSLAAGFWQLDRAAQKIERRQSLKAAHSAERIDFNRVEPRGPPVAWQPVRARGEYFPADTIYLDNRVHQGRPGLYVVTPFRILDSRRVVLVNRGWVPLGPVRHEPPNVVSATGTVTIEGVLTQPNERPFELGAFDPNARIWPNLTLERFTKGRGIAIEPYLLLQTNDAEDGLVRSWELPATGAEKSQSYAVQWFAFAALAVVLYVALNLRRKINAS